MNGPVWRCTGRPGDTMGCLGMTEGEANAARLARYYARACRTIDDPAFVQRYLRGVTVQRRAKLDGMGSVLRAVVQAGQRALAVHPKPRATIKVDSAALREDLEALAAWLRDPVNLRRLT